MATSCADCKHQKGEPEPSLAGYEYLCTNQDHCHEVIAGDDGLLQEWEEQGGLWLVDWAEVEEEKDCPHFESRSLIARLWRR